LAKALELRAGDWVLDLGCGYAEASIYLAAQYNVNVIAADLWQNPAENAERIFAGGIVG
jgi:cyclopropane fatty-acyl-phospholipid synthase-like methyltransferase